MRKDDVEISYHQGTRGLPMVNVKAYHCASASKLAEKLGCTEAQAEHAGELVYESACEQFWEQAQSEAEDYFLGTGVKVCSAGRSGGWCCVEGLPPIESWDAIQLGKWFRFAKWCRTEVEWLLSVEAMAEAIEVNQWHLDGSELYNFYSTKDGQTVCIAELKAQAIAAGFGPVTR